MARKALVIGGGIGGLTAAIALRRAGIEAHVFERAPQLREIGAGLTVWPNGSKVLARIRLRDAMSRITSPLDVIETRLIDGKVLQRIPISKLNRRLGHASVGFHRKELLQLLADASPDRCVHTGAEFQSLEQRSHGVVATLADGRVIRGDVLIGADGIFSAVRKDLFPDEDPDYAGYVCWRGVAELEPPPGWPPNSSVRTMGREKHFGIVQLTAGRYFWYATRDEPEDEPEYGGRKETLLRHFGSWHDPIPQILEATPEEDMLRHGIYEMRPLKAWGKGCVTLIGDAAHPMTPSLGMGACQAMEDAIVLAHYAAKEEPLAKALRSYERHRRRRAHLMVRGSHWLARTEQFKSGLMCHSRDLGTRLLPELVSLWINERSFSFELPAP